jgi:hypothetical protein
MWKATIDSILNTYSGSLSAVLPSLRCAHIPYGIQDGYDAWDEITDVLYRHLVIELIRSSLAQDVKEDFVLPKYEMDYEDYSRMSLITLNAPTTAPEYCVFRNFVFGDKGVHGVEYRRVGSTYKPVVQEAIATPIKGVSFSLLLRKQRGECATISHIECDLD